MTEHRPDKRLIIIDRDGVINKDSADYVKSASEWLPIDGSVEAVARLGAAGFKVAVATNQSGLARGLYDSAALSEMHDKMNALAEAAGGRIDFVAVCPHGPDDGCDCRKPAPGLLLQIAEHFDVELSGVAFIGDSLRDLDAAVAAGAEPVLVRTGNGEKTERSLPDHLQSIRVFDDLAEAADAIIGLSC